MLLRRERPADIAHIDAIHRAAFNKVTPGGQEPVEVGLVHALRADPGWVPALSLVAEDTDGSVVGHVVATEGRVGDVPAVGLGPIGVAPAVQSQGIGAALMHAVLGAADALDYPVVALLGHTDYYPRFGFVEASTLGVTAPSPEWGAHFQARALAAHRPEHGGTFRYARPFDEL